GGRARHRRGPGRPPPLAAVGAAPPGPAPARRWSRHGAAAAQPAPRGGPLRLPLWPTTELQVAMSFSNLAVPGIGGTGMQVRYLQKQGVDLPSAIAAGGLLATVGNLVAAVGLFGLAL